MTDLPPKSRARRLLRKLSREARRERLRCAEAALTALQFDYLNYREDEPGQWIRCEQILRGILRDDNANLAWFGK